MSEVKELDAPLEPADDDLFDGWESVASTPQRRERGRRPRRSPRRYLLLEQLRELVDSACGFLAGWRMRR
jgi:hypothetical protein